MKYGYMVYRLLKAFLNDPEGFLDIIVWLISAAIEAAIISLAVAAIAKLIKKDNDFEEWFVGSFMVVGILEIIVGIIGAFAG